ncbi:MAG: hypothetical protein ACI9KE_004779 [Polyangiales bacterium]
MIIALAGCGDDDSGSPDAGSVVDGGRDTGIQDAGAPDVQPDVPLDVPPDVPPEDAGFDVARTPVTLYTEVELDDATLANAAFEILGHETEDRRCTRCHGLSVNRVREWETATRDALTCIGANDPNVDTEAQAILDCFTVDGEPRPDGMGFVTATLGLDWFTRTFNVAHGFDGEVQQIRYRGVSEMPKPPSILLDQSEVDVLLSWAMRGSPGLQARLGNPGGSTCTDEIRRPVFDHVEAMETEGWAVINRDNNIRMFGCAEGEVGADCLTGYPLASERPYGEGWAGSSETLRVLHEYGYRSSFWTRSSADGRFVSHGSSERGGGATIVDLERGAHIYAQALYDPGFFPDNSGFMLQGGGGHICQQSLLLTNPMEINFGEPECTNTSAVGLYQHMAATRGGDYWTVFGQFVSDNGGFGGEDGPLPVSFDRNSEMSLVPFVYDGSRYIDGAQLSTTTSYEGDAVLSPSGRLVVSRAQGEDGDQSGFVMRSIETTPNGDSFDLETRIVANYCVRGTKVSFSFDERYMTYHRYVLPEDAVELGFTGPDDPAFADYARRGAANVFVLELTTGESTRVTTMQAGQHALFPHFRSDGWLYFIVRDRAGGASSEYVVASDIVL